MHFRVVPVIDLKSGREVHAVGGRRDQYQPLQSVWQESAGVISLAEKLHDALGLTTLYLADLDAIEGETSSIGIYRSLSQLGLEVWIDAGLSDARSAEVRLDLRDDKIHAVVGLESVNGPEGLAGLVDYVGVNRVIFSLDLFDGSPRCAPMANWKTSDPFEILEITIAQGVTRVILLELTRVGTGRGLGTNCLLSRIRERFPELEITVGGGISGIEEIERLRAVGASAVLVGSAIHDGRIGRRELELLDSFSSPG